MSKKLIPKKNEKGHNMIELIYLKNKRTFEADFLIAVDKLEDFKNEYGEDFEDDFEEPKKIWFEDWVEI